MKETTNMPQATRTKTKKATAIAMTPKDDVVADFIQVPEYRTCTVCKKNDRTFKEGHYFMFKWSLRHYAHPECLVKRFGKEAVEKVHDWQLSLFPAVALLELYDLGATLPGEVVAQIAKLRAREGVAAMQAHREGKPGQGLPHAEMRGGMSAERPTASGALLMTIKLLRLEYAALTKEIEEVDAAHLIAMQEERALSGKAAALRARHAQIEYTLSMAQDALGVPGDDEGGTT
jgi:hypothetical protein